MSRPQTVEVLVEFQRKLRSKVTISIDESETGRFVSLRRWFLGPQGNWCTPQGVALQASELREAAAALNRAAEQIEDAK